MGELFNRDISLTIGGQTIASQQTDPATNRIFPMLRTVFQVEKSDNRDPNTATLEMYNLGLANRKVLQAGADLLAAADSKKIGYDWPLLIEAGYVSDRQQIFSGDITFVSSHQERSTWVTEFEAGDAAKKYASARMSKSFGPGTTLQMLLVAVASEMGVGLGNSVAKFALSKRTPIVFKTGVVVNGRVSKILNKYVTNAGYGWSIQDGMLQVLAPDETLIGEAVVLNAGTGLIGTPEVGEKGIVSARSLLQGSISPGRRVLIESKLVNGFYKAQKVVHSGDTWATDWYTSFEGVPVL